MEDVLSAILALSAKICTAIHLILLQMHLYITTLILIFPEASSRHIIVTCPIPVVTFELAAT